MHKWTERFIGLAEHISTWSKDPSRKIGAVIVDANNRILATGFNGFAKGVQDKSEYLNDKETKRALMLHAEENAILHAKQDLTGCHIYIAGLPPCVHCSSIIIQAGITKVWYRNNNGSGNVSEFWANNIKLATTILLEAGVEVEELS